MRIKADLCIIGSGAAGAVLASKLSEKGLKVCVIEEGKFLPPSSFNQREDSMIPSLYRENASQMTKDFFISVMQGRCVGGSPVVNMADCVPLRREIYNFWVREYGFEGPDFEELERANLEIEKRLSVNKIPETELNENNRLLLETARSLGYSAQTFRHNRVNCVGCGYCLIGCRYNAKQSTLITFLEDALKTGTEIYSRWKVEKLHFKGDRVISASGVILEEDKEEKKGMFEVECEKYILACGAIHSPHLLMKSRIFRNGIGENLSLQPQAPVLAVFEKEMRSFRGIPQGVVIDQFEEIDERNGLGGFRIEGIMAGPAMSSYFAPSSGFTFKELMKNYSKIGAVLVLFPDTPSGFVSPGKRAPVIHYKVSEELKRRIKEGLKRAAEVYLRAGAKEIAFSSEDYLPVRKKEDLKAIDGIEIKPAYFKMISAHPQGTVRMTKKGPCDSSFRIRGFKNLYICDSSIFPTTASSHIMLPVMAFAWCAAEIIGKS